MIRLFDILFSSIGLILLSPILLILYIAGYADTKSPLFSQKRVGKKMQPFFLHKFRTMYVDTQSVATHLINPSSVTTLGKFLRKTKLDEVPQLWNVLIGDMSLVGPRPNLFNQIELIEERKKLGIYDYKPGITGLSQIKKIDMSTPSKLAETDAIMLKGLNLKNYLKYLTLTILGFGFGDRIKTN